MNNLDGAKNASVNTWESSDYTDLPSLDYIITTNFPTAKSAWEDYMQRCNRLLEKADPNTRWDLATKALGKSNGKLLSDKKPEWNDELSRWLWDQGVGLCTAFAIAANQSSKIEATYNEYKGKHRKATKTDIANNSATMFSGLHRAWRLQEPATPGFVSIRYIVFGRGSQQQKEICHNVVSQHLETVQSSEGEMRDRVVSRVLEVFAQATQHWGNPMLSLRAELLVDGKVLRAWPSSRYEIDDITV
ncbi:hypothetical protein AA0115_g12265 [Alternaria tenuissima]|uniref:Uncharacterized protein n=1 Tax=Alternaria tenuissima TaxID=119927 RepID=A0AB37W437_9PLEO|nr:hypothetical protein AA0115_g12265 [Alternaria tenuissima]